MGCRAQILKCLFPDSGMYFQTMDIPARNLIDRKRLNQG